MPLLATTPCACCLQEHVKKLQATDALAENSRLQHENQHLAGLVLEREASIAELQEMLEEAKQQMDAANTHKQILLPVSPQRT